MRERERRKRVRETTLIVSGDSCFLVDVHNDMKLPPTNN